MAVLNRRPQKPQGILESGRRVGGGGGGGGGDQWGKRESGVICMDLYIPI